MNNEQNNNQNNPFSIRVEKITISHHSAPYYTRLYDLMFSSDDILTSGNVEGERVKSLVKKRQTGRN